MEKYRVELTYKSVIHGYTDYLKEEKVIKELNTLASVKSYISAHKTLDVCCGMGDYDSIKLLSYKIYKITEELVEEHVNVKQLQYNEEVIKKIQEEKIRQLHLEEQERLQYLKLKQKYERTNS